MSTEIYLVRHGESYSNVEGRLCGRPPGPGLTPRGKIQAAVACRRLIEAEGAPARIVSSPLLRARETAQPLAEAFNQNVDIVAELTETGFGDWEGRSIAQLLGQKEFEQWRLDPEHCPPPRGERLSEITSRIMRCISQLALQHEGTSVVAFSHMHPILGVVLGVLGWSLADHNLLLIPNATIVHLRWTGESFRLMNIIRSASLAPIEQTLAAGSSMRYTPE